MSISRRILCLSIPILMLLVGSSVNGDVKLASVFGMSKVQSAFRPNSIPPSQLARSAHFGGVDQRNSRPLKSREPSMVDKSPIFRDRSL